MVNHQEISSNLIAVKHILLEKEEEVKKILQENWHTSFQRIS